MGPFEMFRILFSFMASRAFVFAFAEITRSIEIYFAMTGDHTHCHLCVRMAFERR